MLEQLTKTERFKEHFEALRLIIPTINKLLEQLTLYESSGLLPEEVKALAKAETEDRLIILPCPIGGTVYKPGFDKVISGVVLHARLYGSHLEFEIVWSDDSMEWVNGDAFGITVFTNKEEAEKHL